MSDPDLGGSAPVDADRIGTTRPSSPLPASRWAAQLARILYTHNPFYVASAWMVFSGLRASFPVSSGSIDAWRLCLCLMGYTLLLSLTAVLVIRLGKVWDDARSLLLLVVLMFLGISVTFDGTLAESPDQAPPYYLLGWTFAVTISELLLRSLPLQLGLLFRVPYHLLLTLLFFYPLVLAPRLSDPSDPVLAWELFAFSSIAAVILLSLLPAVRRGPAYVAGNGSPWPWPWFPWVLFGMIGFCISLRAYYLCVSLHFVGATNSIFAPYFLVPLGLAAILLLLEAGLVLGSQRVVRWALGLPLLVVFMASIGRPWDPVYESFLSLFEHRFGATPLVVTLWLVAAFYLLAAIRGIPLATYPLAMALIALSLIPARLAWTLADPLPMAMAGTLLIALGWRLRRSGDVVIGLCLSVTSAALAGQGTWFDSLHGILPAHMLLIILLGAGYLYHDDTGRIARRAGVVLAVVFATIAALGDPSCLSQVPDWARMLYPLVMTALLVFYSRATKDIWSYAGAAAAAAVGCTDYSSRLYAFLHDRVAGLNELAWGTLFFLLAAFISLLKSGLRPAWPRRKWR
jgi:hypothetical protein